MFVIFAEKHVQSADMYIKFSYVGSVNLSYGSESGEAYIWRKKRDLITLTETNDFVNNLTSLTVPVVGNKMEF
jgi:hypothetical protein